MSHEVTLVLLNHIQVHHRYFWESIIMANFPKVKPKWVSPPRLLTIQSSKNFNIYTIPQVTLVVLNPFKVRHGYFMESKIVANFPKIKHKWVALTALHGPYLELH